MLDLQAETRQLDLAEVTEMQSMKTGALIQCAAICGGIVGGADDRLLDALGAFSRDLGLAFQIADDLLDYDGDAATLGKPTGQDADRGKGSFVALMGADKLRRRTPSYRGCAGCFGTVATGWVFGVSGDIRYCTQIVIAYTEV